MKIVINKCYGGFGLSRIAEELYKERKGITDPNWHYYDIPRDDPILVEMVETMDDQVNSSYSDLRIVEIPHDVNWQVDEYDGNEWVAEVHRIWS